MAKGRKHASVHPVIRAGPPDSVQSGRRGSESTPDPRAAEIPIDRRACEPLPGSSHSYCSRTRSARAHHLGASMLNKICRVARRLPAGGCAPDLGLGAATQPTSTENQERTPVRARYSDSITCPPYFRNNNSATNAIFAGVADDRLYLGEGGCRLADTFLDRQRVTLLIDRRLFNAGPFARKRYDQIKDDG
jgi:hypothetical protein